MSSPETVLRGSVVRGSPDPARDAPTITLNAGTRQERLAQAIDEFYAGLDAGEPIDRGRLLEKYADVADEFDDCLNNLDFIQQIAPQLSTPASVVRGSHDPAHPTSNSQHPTPNIEHPARHGESPVATSGAGILGDFRILRELGRGGMGVVYEAEQISLGRRVALKVLPFAAMLDRQQLARFKNEARAAATLDHPNIVAVHSIGVERGVHYYAMQLIEGQSLAQVVEQLRAESNEPGARSKNSEFPAASSQLPTPQSAIRNPQSEIETAPIAHLSTLPDFDSKEYHRSVAKLGIQAAEALDHAHQNGILHRDIKPANLLVECSHLAPLDGREVDVLKLWITDFGLARMEADAGMTMTGDILGTLRYMSPEQALAKRVVVDHRSDVYSLGVTLYELLTLQPAFTGDDRQELLRQIAFDDPRALRQINARIPQDLETIILKAMEKNPADRYATAGDLAVDLRRFIDDRPIAARRPSLASRTSKWARRHWAIVRVLFASVALGIIGLSVSTVLLTSAYRQSAERQSQAESNLDIAVDTIDRLLARVASDADMHGQLHHAEQLYADAAAAYDRVLANTNDPTFVLKAANSRAQLAEVFKEAGRHDRALHEAERGLQLLQMLSSAANVREREMEGRAKLLGLRGLAQLHLLDFAAAEWSLSEALHLREHLVETATDKVQHLKNLSLALNNLAVLRTETAELDEGEKLFRRALSIREALPESAREDEFWLSDAAGLTCNLATIDRDRGNLAAAEKSFREAIELQRKAMLSRPDYQAYRHDLYTFRWNLTDTLIRAGRHQDAALEVASITSEFHERLHAHVEGVCFLMRCIAIAESTNVDGSTDSRESTDAANDGPAAARYRAQARETYRQTTTATFAPPDSQVALAWLLATCPDRELRDGQRALQMVEQLKASGVQSTLLQQTLSAAHLETKAFDQAYQAAKLSLRSNASGSAHDFLLLALSQAARGEWGEARQWYAQAVSGQTDNCCLQGLLTDAKSVFDTRR
jgi:serine/threonine protein kinase